MRVCILAFVIWRANYLFSAPNYIVNCGPSGSTIFFHRISQSERILEKKVTEHKTCVLNSFTNLVWNISHSRKNSGSYYHKFTQDFT